MGKLTDSKLDSKSWTIHFQINFLIMCPSFYMLYLTLKSELFRDILLSATPIFFLTKFIGFLKITHVLNDCFF